MFKQMSKYFEPFFSECQCGCRKGFSAQQFLLSMFEKWKAADNPKRFGALLTDLSKAFSCLSHNLLIAKLNAYRLSIDSLRLVQDYMTHCKQYQNKFSMQVMGRNFTRSSPGINFSASFIQDLFMWFIFHYGSH